MVAIGAKLDCACYPLDIWHLAIELYIFLLYIFLFSLWEEEEEKEERKRIKKRRRRRNRLSSALSHEKAGKINCTCVG